MKKIIEDAAKSVGITAALTNSKERIETQLNSLTRHGDLPLMLISWDVDVTVRFSTEGFLQNPPTKVVCLLMDKALDNSKDEREKTAEKMGLLYMSFLEKLWEGLIPYQKSQDEPIYEAGYKLAPEYGLGKHSGVIGRFTMNDSIKDVC